MLTVPMKWPVPLKNKAVIRQCCFLPDLGLCMHPQDSVRLGQHTQNCYLTSEALAPCMVYLETGICINYVRECCRNWPHARVFQGCHRMNQPHVRLCHLEERIDTISKDSVRKYMSQREFDRIERIKDLGKDRENENLFILSTLPLSNSSPLPPLHSASFSSLTSGAFPLVLALNSPLC